MNILSFVDKSQLEPGCAVLMHNKVLSIVGTLQDDVDPLVSVMKVCKPPCHCMKITQWVITEGVVMSSGNLYFVSFAPLLHSQEALQAPRQTPSSFLFPAGCHLCVQ